jgi:hypothetical protein
MKQRVTRKKGAQAPNLSERASANGATAGKDVDRPKSAVARPVLAKAQAQKARIARVDVASAGVAAQGKERVKKQKVQKVVRDSFTMPRSDYEKIAVLKQRCLDAGVSVKKSELVRAGLLLLESVSTQRLVATVLAVEIVKTGRPPKSK